MTHDPYPLCRPLFVCDKGWSFSKVWSLWTVNKWRTFTLISDPLNSLNGLHYGNYLPFHPEVNLKYSDLKHERSEKIRWIFILLVILKLKRGSSSTLNWGPMEYRGRNYKRLWTLEKLFGLKSKVLIMDFVPDCLSSVTDLQTTYLFCTYLFIYLFTRMY